MYEKAFNFNARPFTSTPYVKHYFSASEMNQALGQASICILRGSGPVVAIGDIGTGKSLLLAKLAAEHQTEFQVVNIDCSRIQSRKDLLQNILFQLGKPFNLDSETELRFGVIESASPTEACPHGLLLLIDDAETLTTDIFEELRVLTNIVTNGSPQVRIVLAGRNSLEERLAEPSLASFSQRIASRVFLSNLSRDETTAYVIEHINRVGGDGQTMFPNDATAKLHELTDGCPRLINQVCDFVLILASTRGTTTISANLIEESWNDVQSLPMGAGSIAAATTTSETQTEQPNDWTLIEFGQIDDESSEPSNATVYDFENSGVASEPIAGYMPDQQTESEPVTEPNAIVETSITPEPQTDPLAAIAESSPGIDPELGIDLGSLQAMQNEAAAKQTSEVVSNETASTPEGLTSSPTENTDPSPTEDDAARLAMEQQLAAVFGTTEQNVAPDPAPSELATPFSDASGNNEPAINQAVEQNQPPTPAEPTTELTPLAGVASASAIAATLVAGVSTFSKSETPPNSDAFQPATPALDEPAAQEPVGSDENQSDEPPTHPAPEHSDPWSTFTADSVESISPASEPIEKTDQTADHSAFAFPSNPVTESAHPVQDPFGESFASETTVADTVENETIEQNKNALELSSSDLSQLTPLHPPTPEPTVQPDIPQDSDHETDSNLPAGVSWLDSAVDAQEKAAAEVEAATPTLAPEAPATEQEPTSQQAPSGFNRSFSILPMGTPQTTEPTDDEQSTPQVSQFSSADPDEQNSAAPEVSNEAEQVSHTNQSDIPVEIDTDLRTPHNDEATSDEISRKADEILARLNKRANPTPAVEQEEQILSNIRDQQKEVSDSQILNAGADQTGSPSEPPTHRDDSKLLVVNTDTSPAQPPPQPETFPMTDSPISSGRATRMDYEKLFDRLRDTTDENQQ